jgi:VanZ family protein
MFESRHRRQLVAWSQAALGIYWAALLIATHLPAETALLPGHTVDKIYHVLAYAVLSGLLATVWQLAGGHLMRRQLVIVWLVVVLYGAVDEITQIPVGREASLLDWLADAAGAACGIVVFVWLRKWLTRELS